MTRRIPPELIDEIRAANDIVDVVSERIPIKKAGRNYKGLCPFHPEKTPSFNVSPERQIYHCFGCGTGGNVITFLMEYDKMGFVEAVDELARRAGISLRDRVGGGVRDAEDDPIYRLNDAARDYFRRCLKGDAGRAARAYCDDRGLRDDVLDEFEIGYAPPGWDGLIAAMRGDRISEEALEEAGLVVRRKGGGHYDRFRDRLIFPLLVRGRRVVGFGGRAFGDQEPKYLNSPETRVYQKSRFLYGLTEARQALRASREAILVEGYMDVMSLHQADFRNAVASAGTAFTPAQAKVIARYADKVFIAYDGDAAGRAAAVRAAEALVQLGQKVRVARFPDGSDPDSYLREQGAGALKDALSSAQDFIDFVVSEDRPATSEEREATTRKLIDTVVAVQDPLKADLMLEKISEALSIRLTAVARAYEARRAKAADRGGERPRTQTRAGATMEGADRAAQRGLLAILLSGAEPAQRVRAELEAGDFADPTIRLIVERILGASDVAEQIDIAALIGAVDDPQAQVLLSELAVAEPPDHDGGRLCGDYIRVLRRSQLEGEIRDVDRRIQTAEIADDEEGLLLQVTRRQELAERLKELSAGQ